MSTPTPRTALNGCLAAALILTVTTGCGQEDSGGSAQQTTVAAGADSWPTDTSRQSGATHTAEGSTTSATADATSTSPSVARVTPSGTAPATDPEAVPETSTLAPTLTTQAENQATRFMQAYARPPAGLAAMAWWDTVRPYLTPAAAKTLKRQPAQVPFTKVTAPPVITRGQGTDLTATVKTDAGEWAVTLQRTGDDQLLVNALTKKAPPAPTKPGATTPATPGATKSS